MRLMVDIFCKYLALFVVLWVMALYAWQAIITGKAPNLPDWIVMLFTLIVQYFFRKSPEGGNGNKRTEEALEQEKPEGRRGYKRYVKIKC